MTRQSAGDVTAASGVSYMQLRYGVGGSTPAIDVDIWSDKPPNITLSYLTIEYNQFRQYGFISKRITP